MKSIRINAAIALLIFLTGCSSIVSTNGSAKVPLPTIAASDSLANFEIKELVKGQACVTKTLGLINSGDSAFIDSSGKTYISAVERAKAAASFNALSKEGLTTDILVNPVWEIHQNSSLFVEDICAKVVGYRGVIKGFTQLATSTRGDSSKSSFEAPIEKRATNSHFESQAQEVITEPAKALESKHKSEHESESHHAISKETSKE